MPGLIPDIRGRIYNEPERVFAFLETQEDIDEDGRTFLVDSPTYFGISSFEAEPEI